MGKYVCARPIHPGEILRGCLNFSRNDFER